MKIVEQLANLNSKRVRCVKFWEDPFQLTTGVETEVTFRFCVLTKCGGIILNCEPVSIRKETFGVKFEEDAGTPNTEHMRPHLIRFPGC